MEFERDDRFLRDLNPDLHFKRVEGGYRLTSAVFRDRSIGGGFYACSVDSERLAGDQAAAGREARGHGSWGVGRVSLGAVREIGEGDSATTPNWGTTPTAPLRFEGQRHAPWPSPAK